MYLSCILMALVYIHNTITWIHTGKRCVVFLQQTVTSKYSPSRDAHLQLGLTTIIPKPKIVLKCQTVVSLCTFSILMCLPTSPHNSHKHLHICTQPKSKLLDLMQQTALGSSTSQEISWIQYSVNITPTLNTVLSRLNPIHHTFSPYFLKILFNIILSYMSSYSK